MIIELTLLFVGLIVGARVLYWLYVRYCQFRGWLKSTRTEYEEHQEAVRQFWLNR